MIEKYTVKQTIEGWTFYTSKQEVQHGIFILQCLVEFSQQLVYFMYNSLSNQATMI